MTTQFGQALNKTQNPELKARICFMQGVLNWWVQGRRETGYSNGGPDEFKDTSSFSLYYKAVEEYADTDFGREIWSRCPSIKIF